MNQAVTQLDQLPALLRDQTREWAGHLGNQLRHPLPPAVAESLPRVLAASEFVARTCQRQPALLEELAGSGGLERVDGEGDLRRRLQDRLAAVADGDALARELRRFRLREMLRIAWRDLAGWAELEETLLDLSALAELCVDEALQRLYQWQCHAWGTPRNAAGEPQQLVVLGMGKLGGQELNFSSDIDLIFAYPEGGETDAARPRSNDEFFIGLGRKLIAALDALTPEGRVFRVDMRLRPNGDSGRLAMSFDAMELYYGAHGREWERYALIKARAVAGDRAAGEQLLERLRPFVYRRYLDYGALESLRELKEMISREVMRRGHEDNVKLGHGGIREIEFIGQAFQLIRGGRDPNLRGRRILPVLRYLGEHDYLPPHAVAELTEAYVFLRRAENRLQAMDDQQTHLLPADPVGQARLALAMGFADWDGFREVLDGWRRKVQGYFEQVFNAPQAEPNAGGRAAGALDDVWLAQLDDAQAESLLVPSFREPAEAWRRIRGLRESAACRSLTEKGRRRLDRLMPLLLAACAASDRPDATLSRVLEIIEAVARRTAYLALLMENPLALSQLVQLCGASAWIAGYLARHPLLLDELLDARALYAPLALPAQEADLAQRLRGLDENDLEQQMEVLRQFKQANFLRVAAADVTGAVPLMVVSDYLTWTAEATVKAVARLAYREIAARHGAPERLVPAAGATPGFAVVAYGKLGGIELSYGSDLDLVFLYSAGADQMTTGERPVPAQVFFGRVVQRIIHILTTPTAGGVLFEVDTRLRPSGKAGPLASSLEAFAEYQRSSAWTWEHQALVRARVVAGDPAVQQAFDAVRAEVLSRRRDDAQLRREVREMRDRQMAEKRSGDGADFDLKQDRGGIADIEFMVQYGVLSRAHACPALLRWPDNIRLLDELSETGWITADEARLLADAYRGYRSRVHKFTLQAEPSRVPAAEFAEMRASVTALWHRLME